MHDAVFDVSIDAHVIVVGLDTQDERSRRLVLQDHSILTVVLALREQMAQSELSLAENRETAG